MVAMSGGVDSAVAAALLQEQGLEVIGVHLLLWKSGGKNDSGPKDPRLSPFARSAADTAEKLGIAFHLLDLQERFLREVVNPFVSEYLQGRTPNPCPGCNLKIKFRSLVLLADQLSAKYIATGHYARTFFDAGANEHQLFEALSKDKDQAYFLFFVNQEILSRLIFPLREMNKSMVRKQAQELGLELADAKESQDLCFALSGNYAEVVELLSPGIENQGEIIDLSGKILARHPGIHHYTIGQRRGLKLNRSDLYVVKIDPARKQVIVGPEKELYHQKMKVSSVNWIAQISLPRSCQTKIRYRSKKAECRVEPLSENRVMAIFPEPQCAITPGQAAVFYDGEKVLGGGWIEEALD